MTTEEFLSLQEVAERLKLSEQAVRRWIKSGKLKAYQPVREYRIKVSDLDAFLEARATPKAGALSDSGRPDARTIAEEAMRRQFEQERKAYGWAVFEASFGMPPQAEFAEDHYGEALAELSKRMPGELAAALLEEAWARLQAEAREARKDERIAELEERIKA